MYKVKNNIKVIRHLFVCTLFLFVSCDFDIPEKFEMPTWFIDFKIPLVQAKYEIGDISDSANHIYPTEDSMGFQIVFNGEMPTTTIDPENLKVNMPPNGYQEITVDPVPLPGIDGGIFPPLSIEIPPDEAAGQFPLSATELNPGPYPDNSILGGFLFPITESKVMTAENYNLLIVDPINGILKAFFNPIDAGFPLTLPFGDLPIPDEADFIQSIDTLIIAEDATSRFTSFFTNIGFPTPLVITKSMLITGYESLDDTLANHTSSNLNNGQTYLDTTMLGGRGLARLLSIATQCTVQYATSGSDVIINPNNELIDKLAIDFKIGFGFSGVDSADVTITETALQLPEIDPIEFPKNDNEDGGSTRIELFSALLASEGVPLNSNRLEVKNLQSDFPFDINFIMGFSNFYPPTSGGDSIKISETLKKGVEKNFDFSLKGYTMRGADPEKPMSSLDIDLGLVVPAQKATLPLDGTSLGGLGLTVKFGALVFESLSAYIFQGFPSVPNNQELPQGLKGATLADVRMRFIMKSQIQLPVKMDMAFEAIDVFGESTKLIIAIDTVGYPPIGSDLATDTSTTIIELNRFGTRITIYNNGLDNPPDYDSLKTPSPGEGTIIDVMAANPTQLIVDASARIDGRGTIVAGAGLGGSFELVAPLALILEPMTILTQVTKLEEMEFETRSKIRNSLISSDMVFNITNALPFGAELSVLLSNDSLFPTNRSIEMLSAFKDSMVLRSDWNETDVIYIIDECSRLDPSTSDIYIFDVMSDFSECIDYMPYLVRNDGSGTDKLISYVDTLFKFTMPDPNRLYTDEDTLGFPTGMVAEPGTGTYTSSLNANRLRLITDIGDHFVMPRFHINGTDSQMVYISIQDYLEVGSFITLKVSSTGVFASGTPELIITSPNGAEIFYKDAGNVKIEWKTLGDIGAVNFYWSVSEDPLLNSKDESFWNLIESNISNATEWVWADITALPVTEKLRIRIRSSDKDVVNPSTKLKEYAHDMNGWFIKVQESSFSNQANIYQRKMVK